MTNIKSNHSSPLGLPNGSILPAGGTIAVDGWEVIKSHPVVKAWLEVKAIEEDGPSPKAPATDPLDDMTKAELVEEAKKRGVTIEVTKPKDDILAVLKAAAKAS